MTREPARLAANRRREPGAKEIVAQEYQNRRNDMRIGISLGGLLLVLLIIWLLFYR